MRTRNLQPSTLPAAVGAGTIIALGVFVFSDLAGAQLRSVSGKWAPATSWGASSPAESDRYAIHMALLPGDGDPHHSRVLWWSREVGPSFRGGQWGWQLETETCDNYPSANFTEIAMQGVVAGMDPFCAGGILIDGKLLSVGGTSPISSKFGENETRLFTPGSGSAAGAWSDAGDMKDWRWYPSVLPLVDGRGLVLSGNRHRHHRLFGGERDGSLPSQTVGDSVYRFAPIETEGAMDPSVTPQKDNGQSPVIRGGHAFVEMGGTAFGSRQVLFGGRDNTAQVTNDTWFLRTLDNTLGGDYSYRWEEIATSATTPLPRREHAAVAVRDAENARFNMMVVFGGVGDAGNGLGGPHRLFAQGGNFLWDQLDVTNSEDEPALYFGHAAIYDRTVDQQGDTLRRIIVFGGAPNASATPTDLTLYELRFYDPLDPDAATWHEMETLDLGSPSPAPRRGHALVHENVWKHTKTFLSVSRTGYVAFLHGGDIGGGGFSDSLWGLWVLNDGKVGWELLEFGGQGPGPRADHALTMDEGQGGNGGRLYLFGGRSAPGTPANSRFYILDPWIGANPLWMQWFDAGFSLADHSMVADAGLTFARYPEIYDPTAAPSQAWTRQQSAPLLQPTYPPSFLVPAPNGENRVISLSRDNVYWNTAPAQGEFGSWIHHQNIGFFAETGVTYAPGEILVAGGRAGSIVGTSMTLDASDMNNTWQPVGSLEPRFFHNLVLVPTGQVLAVGGVESPAPTATSPARKHPQLWNPDTGEWTPYTQLEAQARIRNYHSTSIILPDGRVLSSGGENHPDKYTAEVYCPPYLYLPNSSTLAERPVISGAPLRVSWGDTVTVCVPETAGITRACLIRPGATTHSFDENQRYVPLSFEAATNPERLFITIPSNPGAAPPGAYMLFLTGKGNAPDVPSLARWLYVDGAAGRDTCDVTPPGQVTDLTVELIGPSEMYLSWSASADDGVVAQSGRGSLLELRRSLQPIPDEQGWSWAAPVLQHGPSAG